MGYSQIKPDPVGDEHIEHAPQQMGTPASGNGIEHNNHE
jgi:hypothetical protein